MKIKPLYILSLCITFSLSAQDIRLSDLKKGGNADVYIGSTSGLVRSSVNSVNQIAQKQYRDSQRYSSSGYANSTTSSNSEPSSTSSSDSRPSSTKTSSRTGVNEVYNGGYKSSDGHVIYRVKCNSGNSASAYKDSSGWWKDSGGSNYGERYRHLSTKQFAAKFCS